jgi:hypothetical protein
MSDLLPPQEAQAVAALDEARRAIERARDIGDVHALLEWRDRAAAVLHYVRRRDEARAIADDAGEVKLRAERAIGELDRVDRPHGVRADRRGSASEPLELDVAKATRASWRKLGALEHGTFDELVVRLRDDEQGGVTTSRAVRLARELVPSPVVPLEHARRARGDTRVEYSARLKALELEAQWLERQAARVVRALGERELDALIVRLDRTRARLDAVRELLMTTDRSSHVS